MTTRIILSPGSSAERDTCGSCKFFERRDQENRSGAYGFCRFQFPAKMALGSDVRAIDPKHKDDEYTGNETRSRTPIAVTCSSKTARHTSRKG